MRQDNALRRLSPIGLELALYTPDERATVSRRAADEEGAAALAETTSISAGDAGPVLDRANSSPIAHSVKIAELAKRQGVSLGDLFVATGVGGDLTGCGRDGRARAQVCRLFRSRTRSGG